MKTLSELNAKPWFRFLKVLYVLVLLLTALFVYLDYSSYHFDFFNDIIEPFLWVLLVLELFKRAIYYTTIGKVMPIEYEITSLIESTQYRLSLMHLEKVPKEHHEMFLFVTNQAENIIKSYKDNKSKENQDKVRILDDMIYNFYCVYQERFSTRREDEMVRSVRFLYLADKLNIEIEKLKVSVVLG